jgi:hypothetical protein
MTKGMAFPAVRVERLIQVVRGQKVILDADLADLYGVETKALNQALKRNERRFPEDFAFRLTQQEATDLKSQVVTSSSANRSQFVTGSQKHRDPRALPMVFTEHGAIMAATVLHSSRAVEMSVFVVRAFVRMREELASRSDMEKRLDQIDKILLVHDNHLRDLFEKIRPLLLPPADEPKKPIGFQVRERRAIYRARRNPARSRKGMLG